MTTVFLVRHPATIWSGRRYAGTTDVPLGPTGRRAVSGIAARLVELAPRETRVVTSPARRAAKPAARIATAGGWPLTVDERWREVNFGAVEGSTFDDLVRVWPRLAARLLRRDGAIDWPDGETAVAFRARVAGAWLAVLSGDGTTTIVVAHAGSIAMALSLGQVAPDVHGGEQLGRTEPGEILKVHAGVDGASRVVARWQPGHEAER